MNAQRPNELHLSELHDGDICIYVRHSGGLFKFKLSPEQSSKLSQCLISDTAGAYVPVISEGEDK